MGIKPLFCEVQVIPFHPQEHQLSCFVHLLQPQAILKEEKHDLAMHIEHNFLGESQRGRKSHFGMRDDLEQSLRKEQSLNMWKEILSRGEITPNSCCQERARRETAPGKKRPCPQNSGDDEQSQAVGVRAPEGPEDTIFFRGKVADTPQHNVPLCTARSPSKEWCPWLGRFCKTQTTVRIKNKNKPTKNSCCGTPSRPRGLFTNSCQRCAAADSAASGLFVHSSFSESCKRPTKRQTRNKQGRTKMPTKNSICPDCLTSEIGGSTIVSLRNFTITNFFKAIRFFLYVSLMP